MTLAAFDGSRLQRWVRILASVGGGRTFLFRQAEDGGPVLPPASPETAGGRGSENGAGPVAAKNEEVSAFVEKIAARSRGNPLVAPLVIKPTARNFLALFGALGLSLGCAFKDYASGLIAGFVALCEHPCRVGDRLTLDGSTARSCPWGCGPCAWLHPMTRC